MLINRILFPILLVISFVGPISLFAQTPPSPEERRELEAQLQQLESQIDAHEKTISEYKKQGASFKGEIGILDAKINKINLQIKAVNLSIARIDAEIKTTSQKISVTEEDISVNKDVLTQTLKNIYFNDKEDTIEILLKSQQISDFLDNVNGLWVLQNNLRIQLQKLVDDRNELLNQKEQLNLARNDKAAQKAYQDSQKATIASTKSEKNNLLSITKGKESEFQKILVATKKTAAEIRNRIFRLLGGGELPFGEAVKLAQVAEKATGVRASLILAVLTQESSVRGVIGANLGSCYYNTPRNNVSGTVMKNDQKSAFLALMADLGLNPDTTPVSCPISSDGAYGGAMGPAQFMPNTWAGYRSQIGAITGGNPVSPFNNLDAFTGTSLYLKESLNSASCKNYASKNQNTLSYQFLIERCAAAWYYAGGNWYIHRLGYGDDVAVRSDKFQREIEILANN